PDRLRLRPVAEAAERRPGAGHGAVRPPRVPALLPRPEADAPLRRAPPEEGAARPLGVPVRTPRRPPERPAAPDEEEDPVTPVLALSISPFEWAVIFALVLLLGSAYYGNRSRSAERALAGAPRRIPGRGVAGGVCAGIAYHHA